MHRMRTHTIVLACLIGAFVCSCAAPDESGAETPSKPRADEIQTSYTGSQIAKWEPLTVDGKACKVSPAINFGRRVELNHHRVAVTYSGGSVELSLAHSTSSKIAGAIEKPYLHSKLRVVKSGVETTIVSPYRGESYAWVIVRAVDEAKISEVTHICWKGKGTLYGHGPGEFKFDGAVLPFRMMLPRNYDPRKKKKYPLVISVSGSGGVGEDNVRSMEKVIFAKYAFLNYYNDKEFECISVVPQIPSGKAVSRKYFPKGPLGKPTPIYHPDWPAVNENGWYAQATLALIKDLSGDSGLGVDPDRIYFTGFSYGGKACWELLRGGRETFASAICGAGWPIGRARSIPTDAMKARLKLEVSRIKHIPVSIFAGQDDRMRYGSKAVHAEITAQGGKSSYVEFPKTGHVQTAGGIWRNRKFIAWLFKQNRKNNPKPGPDPYPLGVYDD
jgi:poly(3-hydroxybutyrate) depolymerase